MAQIILLSIFARSFDPIILLGLGIVVLFIWKVLASSGMQALKAMRRFLLIVFALVTIVPYMKLAGALVEKLDTMFNLNNIFNKIFNRVGS